MHERVEKVDKLRQEWLRLVNMSPLVVRDMPRDQYLTALARALELQERLERAGVA